MIPHMSPPSTVQKSGGTFLPLSSSRHHRIPFINAENFVWETARARKTGKLSLLDERESWLVLGRGCGLKGEGDQREEEEGAERLSRDAFLVS